MCCWPSSKLSGNALSPAESSAAEEHGWMLLSGFGSRADCVLHGKRRLEM